MSFYVRKNFSSLGKLACHLVLTTILASACDIKSGTETSAVETDEFLEPTNSKFAKVFESHEIGVKLAAPIYLSQGQKKCRLPAGSTVAFAFDESKATSDIASVKLQVLDVAPPEVAVKLFEPSDKNQEKINDCVHAYEGTVDAEILEVALTRSANSSVNYDAGIGARLAYFGRQAARGNYRPTGVCWANVGNALDRFTASTGRSRFPNYRTQYAAQWARVAVKQSNLRGSMGLCYAPEYSGGKVMANAVPLGAVTIYRPSKCGFHRLFGHVEIKIGENQFASDFMTRNGRNCSPDWVFLPCK